MSWADDAACAGMDTEIFFPPPGGRDAMTAKAICAGCTVTAQCLASVIHIGIQDDHGIFAGTSRTERLAIRMKEAT